MRRAAILLCLGLGLAACSEFPELDGVMSDQARDADYPTLLPFETLFAQAYGPTRLDARSGASLAARADALRRRAEALKRTRLIDPASRRRMQAAVARHGA